jgi:DNA-3-methyladenine glycosylase
LSGPGKLTRQLGITERFKGKMLGVETGLWIENKKIQPEIVRKKESGLIMLRKQKTGWNAIAGKIIQV